MAGVLTAGRSGAALREVAGALIGMRRSLVRNAPGGSGTVVMFRTVGLGLAVATLLLGLVRFDDPQRSVDLLVDQSLVLGTGPAAGQARFSMLETIREFGQDRLEATGDLPGGGGGAVAVLAAARAPGRGPAAARGAPGPALGAGNRRRPGPRPWPAPAGSPGGRRTSRPPGGPTRRPWPSSAGSAIPPASPTPSTTRPSWSPPGATSRARSGCGRRASSCSGGPGTRPGWPGPTGCWPCGTWSTATGTARWPGPRRRWPPGAGPGTASGSATAWSGWAWSRS